MLSELSQTEKEILYDLSYMSSLRQTKDKKSPIKLTDTENRLVVARGSGQVEENSLGKSSCDIQMLTGHRKVMYLVSKGCGREGHGVTDFGYPMEQHYQGPSNPNIGNDSQQEKRKLPTAGLLLLPYWMPNMRRDKQVEKKQRKHNFFVSLPLIVFTSATLILYFPCSFPVSACHPFWEGMSLSLDLFLFVIAQAQVILSL